MFWEYNKCLFEGPIISSLVVWVLFVGSRVDKKTGEDAKDQNDVIKSITMYKIVIQSHIPPN